MVQPGRAAASQSHWKSPHPTIVEAEKTFKLFVLLPTAGPARKEVPDDPTEGDFGQGVLAETGKGAENSLAELEELGQLAQVREQGRDAAAS